jgi:6-pyruvoyltetrahydropterin/6-carboxytetrahydropterin synthase
MTVTLTKSFSFEAAQFLPRFPEGHKCRNMHGHSFVVEVSITGAVDELTGIYMDHAEISRAMEPVINELDHACLNDLPGLENPTIEVICRWIWNKLKPSLPGLSEIRLYETARAWCSYRGE